MVVAQLPTNLGIKDFAEAPLKLASLLLFAKAADRRTR
jgi:hypothetical protein